MSAPVSDGESLGAPQAWQPQTLRIWHEAMISDLLLEPAVTYRELGARYGVSEVTVGLVVRSDMFQMKLRERREALAGAVQTTVVERLDRVAGNALDELNRRLEAPTKVIMPTAEIIDSAKLALSMMGYGQPRSPGAVNIINNMIVSAADLEEARRKQRDRAEALRGPVLDGTALPATA